MASCKQAAAAADVMDHWLQDSLWLYLDPADYFYPDAHLWLRTHKEAGHQIHILSIHQGPHWGMPAEQFQRIKLARSGVAEFVDSVTVVSGQKAEHIDPLLETEQRNIFIDDLPTELDTMRQTHPSVHCIRVRRPQAKHSDAPTPEGITEVAALQEISL